MFSSFNANPTFYTEIWTCNAAKVSTEVTYHTKDSFRFQYIKNKLMYYENNFSVQYPDT